MLCAILVTPLPAAAQDLRGHGGPVRALDIEANGRVISGSFDTRAIVWEGVHAVRITRHHVGAVTAVAALPQGRFATGGQDGRVAIWGNAPEPIYSEILHPMAVGALTATADGIASAGWEGRIALWSGTDAPRYIDAHGGQITGLVAYRGGLASIGADLQLRFWQADGTWRGAVGLPTPASALATYGTALFIVSPDGTLRRISVNGTSDKRKVSSRPLLSIAIGEGRIAVGAITGEVWLIDPETLDIQTSLRTGQGPIWALAISKGVLFTGGNDGLIRRWSLDGTPLGMGNTAPDSALATSRGAQVFRACAVCHTLTPDDGARAGPTLYGIFGRAIAASEGYAYSDALKALDIIWTPKTISELFEFGPDAYTPGSRMPEQRIPSVDDRAALIQFLQQAARPAPDTNITEITP